MEKKRIFAYMATAELNQVLDVLDFNSKSVSSTLFYTSQNYTADQILFEERLVFDFAKKINVTAVYFRRFGENRSSLPQLFVFDNTTGRFSENDIAEIHRKLWSSGIVPLYYVFDKVNIKIYDARKQVNYDSGTQSIQISCIDSLSIVAKTQKHLNYSAKLFANGTFWDQKETANYFLSKESAENKLIEGLKQIRTRFIHETQLEKNLAHQLIVLSILVKYLEERKDEEGNHVFPSDFFNAYDGANSFCDVLRGKGKIVELFGELSKHFNGKIFELKPTDEAILKKTDLSKLAQYLDANVDNDQLVIWPLYSFEYLPVELISRIYEEFIPERKDAVYTPIHLARFMVDECMPISNPKADFKAIDVSCGSGVFLVTVFKRLVQWWQKERFDKTGKLINPEIDDLKAILLNSIYGVDIEADSVRLSVFSLSIALCDMLKPTEIWTKLRFEDLRQKNIYEGDFFQYLKDTDKRQFDLVIGNPPFEELTKIKFEKLVKAYKIDIEKRIPQNQISLLFMLKAMGLLKSNGLLCLVMPSGPLLYNNTIGFRHNFFSNFRILQIVDFSNFYRKKTLFEKEIATAVVFVENTVPDLDDSILHITVKRTKSSKERIQFEIDTYDFHNVPYDLALNDSLVWKSNFILGSSLYFLNKRIAKIRNLKSFIDELKVTDKKCDLGQGYISGIKNTKRDINGIIYGKPTVVSFSESGEIEERIQENQFFKDFGKVNVYKAPHLLLKKNIGQNQLYTYISDKYLTFGNEIVGLSVTENSLLFEIANKISKFNNIIRAYLLSISNRAGIRKSPYVIETEDIYSIPFPQDEKELKLSLNEEMIINDVLKYYIEQLSKGENAKINTTLASAKELEEFGQVFCDSLNAIYQQNGKSFQPMEPIKTLSYTCFPFSYGNADFNPVLASKIQEGDLTDLIENEQESVHYRRVLRLYQKDMVFLIKPNTLRYWLKSIALRDASDVMVDLINSGY